MTVSRVLTRWSIVVLVAFEHRRISMQSYVFARSWTRIHMHLSFANLLRCRSDNPLEAMLAVVNAKPDTPDPSSPGESAK